MSFKYKLSKVWIAMGILWLLITSLLANSYIKYNRLDVMVVVLAPTILVSIYYFFMPKITYVKITDKQLLIHKSFIVFKYKIDLDNIHHCSLMRKDFVVFTNNEKVHPIHMDWIKKEEMIQLAEYLSSNYRTTNQNKQKFKMSQVTEILK